MIISETHTYRSYRRGSGCAVKSEDRLSQQRSRHILIPDPHTSQSTEQIHRQQHEVPYHYKVPMSDWRPPVAIGEEEKDYPPRRLPMERDRNQRFCQRMLHAYVDHD